MNGYYRRRSCLPFEEIRPLEINEIEFVSDVGGEHYGKYSLCECPLCGEEDNFDEDLEDEDEDEFYCRNWCQNLTTSEQREKNENK